MEAEPKVRSEARTGAHFVVGRERILDRPLRLYQDLPSKQRIMERDLRSHRVLVGPTRFFTFVAAAEFWHVRTLAITEFLDFLQTSYSENDMSGSSLEYRGPSRIRLWNLGCGVVDPCMREGCRH